MLGLLISTRYWYLKMSLEDGSGSLIYFIRAQQLLVLWSSSTFKYPCTDQKHRYLSLPLCKRLYVDVCYHREFSSSVRLKRAFGPRFRTVLWSPRGPRGLAALRPSGRAAGLTGGIFVMGWLRDRRSTPWPQSGDAVYELPSNTPRLLLQNQLMGQSWRNTAAY